MGYATPILPWANFSDKSKSASWFNDTLLVVVADHGARVYGSQQFPLASYQIPLLLLATGHLKAGEATMPISQIDIAPTVLGLLGLPYTAPFFGQNAFAEADSDRVLLLNHNHDVALFKQGKLAVLGLRNAAATYDCKLDTAQLHLVVKDEHLLDLGAAYYQSAFDMFITTPTADAEPVIDCRSSPLGGQAQGEHRPLRWLAADGDSAAMQLGDTFDDGQPQAGAAMAGGT